MTDWTLIAAALDPPVPQQAASAVTPVLERLESALAPTLAQLPIDTLPWNGCDE